jgi:hypothetical protein
MFIYSEKATKFCEIFPCMQTFVAFSEVMNFMECISFDSYFFGDKFKYCLSNPTQTLAHWIEYPIRKLRIFYDDLILYNFIHSYFFGDKFKYPLSKTVCMYRGSSPYAHFVTWKKSCYMKFVLVGLCCGPLLTL